MAALIEATAGQPLDEALGRVIDNAVRQLALRPGLNRVLEFEEERLPARTPCARQRRRSSA